MKKIIDFTVMENRMLNCNMFLLSLFSDELPEVKPGQFVNIKVEGEPSTFLRRPISIYDVDEEKKLLFLLIKAVGAGTQKLSELQRGERLNVILPLGNTFCIPKTGRCLLMGGGVGIAPLYLLSKELNQKGTRPTLLIGVRSKEDIVLREEFEKYADLYYTTEDGSEGERGYPTQHSLLKNEYDHIFCCGPELMMKEVAKYAYANYIDCEVSLENMMACGFGVCLCCVTDTVEGHKCVCTEGPVFNIKNLKWQI
ncbi:MAG: dihydroorotate dehydrogenase electron transfer subunit [Odoribacter sp.]|nr:dihydroorotate dehydrogenase electron transfer subunit [Odoribacter sp.]